MYNELCIAYNYSLFTVFSIEQFRTRWVSEENQKSLLLGTGHNMYRPTYKSKHSAFEQIFDYSDKL